MHVAIYMTNPTREQTIKIFNIKNSSDLSYHRLIGFFKF